MWQAPISSAAAFIDEASNVSSGSNDPSSSSSQSAKEFVVASDTPLQELPGVPPGFEVILQGKPILPLNPATNNLTAPARLLRQSLVHDRYFFTLPRNLWDETCSRIGAEAFEPELSMLEDEFGAICGDHSANAGLWRGRAFPYQLLYRLKLPKISAAAMGWDINQTELDRQLRIGEERSAGIARTARGYLGWLLLNRQFLNEHDTLLQTHHAAVARWGTAAFGLPASTPEFDDPMRDEALAFRAADAGFAEFLCRWRLKGLAAPYLPVPLQPSLAERLPEIVLRRHLQTGGLFVVPDTFPLPSRDEFRGMLDDALHSSPPDHLAEWMTFIAGNNTGKQSISRFARLFQLQHYWRVLHHRHRAALRRKTTMLKQVFASFLEIGEQSIHQDLIEIRRRLGPDWVERGGGSSIGPF